LGQDRSQSSGRTVKVRPLDMSTFLTWASVKPSTRKVYMEALREFRDWLDAASHPLTPSDHRSFDRALTQFAHDTYRSNPKRGARQVVVNARCAVNILYPHTTHKLPSTDRALRGWSNLRPPATKPPISYGFALLLTHGPSRGRFRASLLLHFGFRHLLSS